MAEMEDAPLFPSKGLTTDDRPYFGGADEAPLFQPKPTPQPTAFPKEQYENMPWGEVLSRGVRELAPSAGRSLAAIPSAIYNYPETGRALKEIGLGAAGRLGLYQEKDPEARARQAQMVETMVEPFTSVAGFKKTLAEDPYAILSAAATPFGGGLAKAGEIVGAASTAGRTLSGLGKAARYAMDPTQAAMGAVGDVAGYGLEKLRGIRDISTNVPRYSYEKAFEAGTLPEGDIGKQAFKDFASGQGSATEFSQRARKATEALRNQAMQDWVATKGQMTGAHTQPLSYQTTLDAISKARSELTPRDIALAPDIAAHDALDTLERNIANRTLKYGQNNPVHTLFGFDRLKQNLWDFANDETKGAADRNAALAAYRGVKETINQAAPEYGALMDQFQAIDDQIKNVQKTLGTTNKTAANAEMAKFLKAQKTPEGVDLISQLAQHDPVLPFMTAGSTLRPGTASGVPGAIEKGSLPLHALNIATGVLSANPFHALSAMGLAGAQTALQSPSLMGDISYKAGKIASSRPAAAARALPKVTRAAQPVATQLTRARPEIEREIIGSVTPMEEEPPYFPGPDENRPVRATGGRIGMTAERLLSMLEGAKRSVQKDTEALLQEPDEKIAKALTIAKEGI